MAKDINDLDYTVDVLFNMDGTKKYDRIDSVVRKSTNCTPTRNTRRKKQKPKGINELAKKSNYICNTWSRTYSWSKRSKKRCINNIY